MGAEQFYNEGKGKTAQEAFDKCVAAAKYDHGHAGYTGTIAEKDCFVVFELHDGSDVDDAVNDLLADLDKWGPAGCIKLAEDHYAFFGLASS